MLTLSGVKTAAASPTEVTSAKVPAAVQADIPRTDNAAQRRVVLQEASRQQQQNDQLTLTTAAGSADIPNDSVRVQQHSGQSSQQWDSEPGRCPGDLSENSRHAMNTQRQQAK